MASTFSLSKSSLNLTPPTITGGPSSNYGTAGNAVNVARIFKANRAAAPDMSGIVAQNTASQASIKNAIEDAEATARKGALGGFAEAYFAKKQADDIKAAARKNASKSMFASGLGMVGTIGGAAIGGPMGAMIGGGIGQTLGGLFG
ncbi:MAG: hypothetical protein CBC87_00720 [Rickettsiales bacterium TMED127]|jgi:hypothetical protein|nr:MAG: hypothetical protein CBC87_00720 [Rickettsiales bacterium TMED127]